ncbi:MAG: G5 domain-containing protein [Clostridia bacterium]|nr:G5 domain-containing protein [Clostridia bacterium]
MNNSDMPRQLPDVFKELQQSRFEQELNTKLNINKAKMVKTSEKRKKVKEKISQKKEAAYRNMWNEHSTTEVLNFSVKKAAIVTMGICAIVLTVVSKNYIFAGNNEEEPIIETSYVDFEANDNAINLTQIVSENASMVEAKDYVKEEREVDFETVYIEDTSLQKDEKVVTQEGSKGKEEVTAIKTYHNGEFIEENIIERTVILEPIKSVVHTGTSEFLSTYKVHLGDILYVTSEVALREKASDSAKEIVKIPQYYDVKLVELAGDWCKVSFNGHDGYIKNTAVTSSSYTPGILEQNRKQKIFASAGESMSVNKASGLTLEDFKKALSNNPKDVNKIFENNAEAFFNAEQKYNVNGLFIAAIGINESAWGTSNIASTKKNLFGYGAYDRDPYNSSYTFETYEDGIDLVTKVMAKYYLNPAGTKIYGDEMASGKYYNGPTIAAVNMRYASDTDWAKKVYTYMELLYNKLK